MASTWVYRPSVRALRTAGGFLGRALVALPLGLWVMGVPSHAQTLTGAPVVADVNSPSGQSASGVFVDTTKLPGSTVDARIVYCLSNYVKPRCDASQDSSTISATITVSQSGATLILGSLTASSSNGTILSITGNYNYVYCAQGWNTLLDASAYLSSGSPAISITGNGNKFYGCSIKGSYLNTTGAGQSSEASSCISVLGNGNPDDANLGTGNDNDIENNMLRFCGGTQFTPARYVETLNQLGITHRRTAYNHPEGNSYIERFHRSLKEEEVWLNEYQNFDQARLNIARWIQEYNHDRPHRGLRGRTPHESRAQFLAQTLTSNTAPCV